jgi:hypothetical protein
LGYIASMEKRKCDLCRQEKSIKEFRLISNNTKREKNTICRKCESHRGSELWL